MHKQTTEHGKAKTKDNTQAWMALLEGRYSSLERGREEDREALQREIIAIERYVAGLAEAPADLLDD